MRIPIIDDDDPAPKLIGRCVIVPPGQPAPHAIKIFDDDIDAVDMGKKGEFACGECAQRLLQPKPVSESPEKGPKQKQRGRGPSTKNLKPGPRLHKGEDLRK